MARLWHLVVAPRDFGPVWAQVEPGALARPERAKTQVGRETARPPTPAAVVARPPVLRVTEPMLQAQRLEVGVRLAVMAGRGQAVLCLVGLGTISEAVAEVAQVTRRWVVLVVWDSLRLYSPGRSQ